MQVKIEKTVYVVDDDEAVRQSLEWLLSSVGLKVHTFDSAQAFLKAFQPTCPCCLLTDVRMPGMSGLDLQQKLHADNICLPVILITGHGDVQMAVRAMKDGAYDFIEKPFNDQVILDLVHRALEDCSTQHAAYTREQGVQDRIDSLTPREREVLDLIVTGDTNKAIAYKLDISDKTVEVHRSRVMEKLAARSLADLVRQVTTCSSYQG